MKAILMATLLIFATTVNAEPVKIAVSQFVEHPALNAVLKGFKDDLKENGIVVKYKKYNAHGNMGTASQIATQIASDEPALILAIATPCCAQACAKVYDKAPQLAHTLPLFSADTDSVKRRAIAALGFDCYLHGKQIGAMARKILTGTKPEALPVEFQKDLSFHVNPKTEERMGLVIDKAILDSAETLH